MTARSSARDRAQEQTLAAGNICGGLGRRIIAIGRRELALRRKESSIYSGIEAIGSRHYRESSKDLLGDLLVPSLKLTFSLLDHRFPF